MVRIDKEKIKDAGTGITALRASIDEIDEKILALINRRLLLAREIGRMKAEKGSRVLDIARESTLIQRLNSLNEGP
ncbi:MAG: chorismate mutase, partial [Desulfobacterales bacterium]|nr:chorismate mutase [Desulfobacterales bacterium]